MTEKKYVTTDDYKKRAAARKVALGGGDYLEFQRLSNKIRQSGGNIKQRKQGNQGGVGASLGDSSGTAAQTREPLTQGVFNTNPSFGVGKLVKDTGGAIIGGLSSFAKSVNPSVPSSVSTSTADLPVQEGAFVRPLSTEPTITPTTNSASLPIYQGSFAKPLVERLPQPEEATRLGAFDVNGNKIDYSGRGTLSVIPYRQPTTSYQPVESSGIDVQLPTQYERELAARNQRVDINSAIDDVRRAMQGGRMNAKTGAALLKSLYDQKTATYNDGGYLKDELEAAKLGETARANKASEALQSQKIASAENVANANQSYKNQKLALDNARLELGQFNKDRDYLLSEQKYNLDVAKFGVDQANKERDYALKLANLADRINQTQISGDNAESRKLELVFNSLKKASQGEIPELSAQALALETLGPDAIKMQIVDENTLQKLGYVKKDQ